MNRSEAIKTAEFAYEAVYEKAPEGGYIVHFPAIPGLVTEGETLSEARSMATDALKCFVEGAIKDGQHIPPSDVLNTDPIRERVSVVASVV